MILSTFKNYLDYYFYSLLHPSRRDYLSSGIGIRERNRRIGHFWKRHLESCRAFQRKALEDLGPISSVFIPGCGELLDIDIEHLALNSESIHCLDANPLAEKSVKRRAKPFGKSGARVSFSTEDISGVMDEWTERLCDISRKTKDSKEIASFIKSLDAPRLSYPEHELVLSINVLSQIPIFWKDRAADLILKNAGISIEGDDCDEDLKLALESSYGKLQKQHIELLAHSASKAIIFISDTSFTYYGASSHEWDEDRAIFCDWPPHFNSFDLRFYENWNWDIAPQGFEFRDFGSMHPVSAFYFKRL